MAGRIVVKVGGALGLDDSEQLLAELARGTGLDWHEEPVPQGRHLSGGPAEFLLAAVVSGAAGKAGEYAYDRAVEGVRAVVARWSARRLDPLAVRVDLEEADEGADEGAPPHPPSTAPASASADPPADPGPVPAPDTADRT